MKASGTNKGAEIRQGGCRTTDGKEVVQKIATGFVARLGKDWAPICMGADIWCERNVIDATVVPDDWEIIPLTGVLRAVEGINGITDDHFIGVIPCIFGLISVGICL